MNRKNITIGATAIALLAMLTWVFIPQKGSDSNAITSIPVPITSEPTANLRLDPESKEATPPDTIPLARTPVQLDQLLFAPSLEGTDIDGHLRVGGDGNLIIELASRDFFDYFLATSSEVGVESAINEILRYIDTYLPEPALQQARELFSQYLRYKKFNSELQRTPIAAGMDTAGYINLLRNTFEKQKSARLEIFSSVANKALFGLEDQHAEYTLRNMSIQNNPDLSSTEKADRLAENRATLPIDVQTTLANQEQATVSNQKVSMLINSKLDDTQVYSQLIEQGYDHSRAEQILAYRQQQNSFEQRYQSYQTVSEQLQDLPQKELSAALTNLRGQYFISEQEQTQARLRDLNNTQ